MITFSFKRFFKKKVESAIDNLCEQVYQQLEKKDSKNIRVNLNQAVFQDIVFSFRAVTVKFESRSISC